MNTTVYVDVLLVINYIINILLLQCISKIWGVKLKRRKIVIAALFGCLCSLTIFLPFLGFVPELLSKIVASAIIVRLAMPFSDKKAFLCHWFSFFAASFFFAGVVLGIWMLFAPRWMIYYNGIVYFDISSFTLIVTAILAYAILEIINRFMRAGRVNTNLCKVKIFLDSKMCSVSGLVDTGNSLTEPFSGSPVIVCWLDSLVSIFSIELVNSIKNNDLEEIAKNGFRLIPYNAVGIKGILPAFAPDKLLICDDEKIKYVENIFIAVSIEKIGNSYYSAILNSDILAAKTELIKK